MLGSLHIKNYAIIRELDVDFLPGFTTITGETGAGKSILLGALSLVLGQRADLTVLQNKELKCLVEAIFVNIPHKLDELLQEKELDSEESLTLRREILPSGKSRAFINDTPVTLTDMRELGSLLVDIHSQHENLNLGNNIFQLEVLDSFSKVKSETTEFRKLYQHYREKESEYNRLKNEKDVREKELEFLQFQFDELDKLKLASGEMQELEEELELLQNAEEIKLALMSAATEIQDDENGLLYRLRLMEHAFAKTAAWHRVSAGIKERLNSCLIELKDIGDEAYQTGEQIEYDPARQEFVEQRLGNIFTMLRKHNKKDTEELIVYRNELRDRIEETGSFEFRLEGLEKELGMLRQSLNQAGQQISEVRTVHSRLLERKVLDLVKQLGIKNADFKISIEKLQEPLSSGFDRVRFLFSANKNSEIQDIATIASGGELSRLMLAIKYITSGSSGLPTMIFDEIDTGVSGEIAAKVSLMMKEMANNHQVFSITHLPQVAARGAQHYLVYKSDERDYSETKLRMLESAERLDEVAKMLSGEETTSAARENARELLGL